MRAKDGETRRQVANGDCLFIVLGLCGMAWHGFDRRLRRGKSRALLKSKYINIRETPSYIIPGTLDGFSVQKP